MSPICLLDVDGVLNALRNDRKGGQEKRTIRGYTFRFPAGIRDRVAKLEQHFQLVWCTTWWDEIKDEIAPRYRFGQDWPVVPLPWTVGVDRAGDKVPLVDAWLAERTPDRPVCWIDDEPGPGAEVWVAGRTAPTKLIMPDPGFGLTDDQVAEAVAWARSLTRGNPS